MSTTRVDHDRGALTCYVPAALAKAGHAWLAVILPVASTILLYFKAQLSGAARGFEHRYIIAILQFAVVTFVVLPLLREAR